MTARMRWFKKKDIVIPKPSFVEGQKVYITTIVNVYSGVIVTEDKASDGVHISSGRHWIVRVGDIMIPISESFLTPYPTNKEGESHVGSE